MSPLDSAYAAAKNDPQQKSQFYNTFLNAELFIPTHDKAEAGQQQSVDGGESISPLFVESGGIQYLMLFDSLERLNSWAKKEAAFTVLTGHVIVEMMPAKLHWALNVGTDYVKAFVPEEIQGLKQVVEKSRQQQANAPKATSVLIRTPASLPEGLIEFLCNNFSTNKNVKRAYLGLAHYAIAGEEPHLTLVIGVAEVNIDAIRRELAIAIKGFLAESESVDILFEGESSVANEITKAIEPFYQLAE